MDISINKCNRVIVNNDLTEEYYVNDGIDQDEVWSPLLWRIFYDPLLVKLDMLKKKLGYKMEVEYKENINKKYINAIAFMDDTTFISKSREGAEEMLEVCHSFYKMNDVKANPNKYEIIKINNKEERDVMIEGNVIKKCNMKDGNRFFRDFFTHNNNRWVHIEKIEK
ncbi:hypothetical protein RirG_001260 [Rhizophagus irregularis DAOM 197198w]|nr:hypothetical protein RirG_249910 [Rhizophagus irregularis DAOM 197198w]EXX79891.1 hypothetical protein RirG_001260 [Rhizophagus irregularis DAOM 197198w]